MSLTAIGCIGAIVLLVLMFLGVPMAFVMGLVGFLGSWVVGGFNSALTNLASAPYSMVANFSFSVLPLFILMGMFMFYSDLSGDLYYAAHKWLGQLRGGLCIATVVACAGFGAVCGDTLAGGITMGKVAYPEMRKYNYDPALSSGSIAAGGTLAILIPPSIGFVLYSILTGESVGKLFIAGIIPGILLTTLFSLAVLILCRLNPNLGPSAAASSFKEMLISLKRIWGMVVLFLLVMGGIYGGIFTPTEAGAIGAFGAFIFTIARRKLSAKVLFECLRETGLITSMIFLLIIGATIFQYFFATTKLPIMIAETLSTMPVPPIYIMAGIMIFYILLGMIMEINTMMILTIPIIFPVILNLGFDPIWFGVFFVLQAMLGVISPPVGFQCFVLSDAMGIPLGTMFRGVIPFVVAIWVCLVILLIFPQIATWLPSTMFGT